MKTLLTTLILLLIAAGVTAAPFLVCDPIPTSMSVSKFIVTIDGIDHDSTPEDLGDGEIRLHYDLSWLPDGDYTMSARSANMWGESEPSTPITITVSTRAT